MQLHLIIISNQSGLYILNTIEGDAVLQYRNKMMALCGFAKAKASVKRPFALTAIVTSPLRIECYEAKFDPRTYHWQFATEVMKIPADCSKIQIACNYKDNINSATFKNILFKPCKATVSESVYYLDDANNTVVSARDIVHIKFEREQSYVDLDSEQQWYEWVEDKVDINKIMSYDRKVLMKQMACSSTEEGVLNLDFITCNNGSKRIENVRNVSFVLKENCSINGQTSITLPQIIYIGSKMTSEQGVKYSKTNINANALTGLPTGNYNVWESADETFALQTTKQYNNKNLLMQSTDCRGVVTKYTYDTTTEVHSNPISVKVYQPGSTVTCFEQSFTYTNKGDRVTDQEDQSGNTNSTAYDELGFADATTDGNGNKIDHCTTSDLIHKCSCQPFNDTERAYVRKNYKDGLAMGFVGNDVSVDFVYDGMTNIKSIDIAGNNYLSATVDNANNTSTITYNNGYTATTNSDDYGNVLTVKEGNTIKVTNGYVGQMSAQKLSSHIDNYASTNVSYQYDSYGDVCNVTESSNNAVVARVETQKDGDNRLSKKITELGSGYGSATLINTYFYTEKINDNDQVNKLDPRLTKEELSVGSSVKKTLTYDYDPFGRITSKYVPFKTEFEYKTLNGGTRLTGQVEKILYDSGTQFIYEYDKNGNIEKVTYPANYLDNESEACSIKYAYDKFNRIVEEFNCLLNQRTVYTYDKGGNLTNKVVYKCKGAGTQTLSLEYTDVWKDKVTKIAGQDVGYDAIGNPTSYKGKGFSWIRGRLLESITFDNNSFGYTYNSAGQRIAKCINNVETKYALNGNSILSETTGGTSIVYYHTADGVIGFNYNGADYYYNKNLQGDVIELLNASKTVVAKYVYDAFGEHKIFDANNNVIFDSTNPTSSTNVACVNPYRYRSYYFDKETGFYYVNGRYYDPSTGRFLNPASIENINPDSLFGINLYINNNIQRESGFTMESAPTFSSFETYNRVLMAVDNSLIRVNMPEVDVADILSKMSNGWTLVEGAVEGKSSKNLFPKVKIGPYKASAPTLVFAAVSTTYNAIESFNQEGIGKAVFSVVYDVALIFVGLAITAALPGFGGAALAVLLSLAFGEVKENIWELGNN